MPIAAFANLGCKVNQYETDRMVDAFAAHGFEIAAFDEPADVYVINTCSVTSMADRKSRQMARRAARQKPGARVVLTGCFAQLALETGELVDGAALLVANRDKMRVVDLTLDAFPELIARRAPATASRGAPALFPEEALVPLDRAAAPRALPQRLAHTRETLKVQDGCQHYCAFCSIPYTRDTMASRSLDAAVAEARSIAARGTREIVVTGVCVGAYRCPDTGVGLAGLLERIAAEPGLARLRLSSLQPVETSDDLIDVVARHPTICNHLHLSLQSGDDSVLSAMQRPYRTSDYRALIRRLRERIPGIAITTDIIVGFPGETHELFDNTRRFAEEIGFARAHIFRYSPRERTHASRCLVDDVPPAEKERRHRELTAVCAATQARFAGDLVGHWTTVLVEGRGRSHGLVTGYTDTYVRVHLPGGPDASGKLVRARIDAVTESGDAIAGAAELLPGERSFTTP